MDNKDQEVERSMYTPGWLVGMESILEELESVLPLEQMETYISKSSKCVIPSLQREWNDWEAKHPTSEHSFTAQLDNQNVS